MHAADYPTRQRPKLPRCVRLSELPAPLYRDAAGSLPRARGRPDASREMGNIRIGLGVCRETVRAAHQKLFAALERAEAVRSATQPRVGCRLAPEGPSISGSRSDSTCLRLVLLADLPRVGAIDKSVPPTAATVRHLQPAIPLRGLSGVASERIHDAKPVKCLPVLQVLAQENGRAAIDGALDNQGVPI